MAEKCNRDESDDTTTTSGHNAVFVDTNLETHLAVIVSHSDTVSDLKKKIISEHPLCFPQFGEIKINALKVKRKRCFYHLSDSMLVKSAFKGAKKYWFVYVDAFSLKQHDDNQFPIDHAISNQLAVVRFTKTPTGDLYTSSPGIGNPEFALGNTVKDVLNDVEMTSVGVGGEPCNTPILVDNVRSGLGEIQGTHVEYSNDKSRNLNGDVDLNDPLVEEEHSKSRPIAKKKRKRESKGDENPLAGNGTLLSNVIEDNLKPKDKILENSTEYKLKTTMTTSDSLFTELPEDVHMTGSGSGNKISKKMNSCMASVAAIVSDINMQYANPLETFEVPQMQKRHESVQEVVEKDKLPSSSVDSLCREPPEDDHLIAGTREKKKSKKMRKLPADQVIDMEPSSLLDVRIEEPKENVGTASKDSDKVSGLVTDSEQNVQHATLSGTVKVSKKQKQKHSKPVQEAVEENKLPSSSMDSLFTEPSEDGHLVAGSSRGTKESKKKKKLATDEAVNAEPSSLHDAGIEGCKENVGTLSKDSDKESGLLLVSEQNDQCATLPVQKVVEGHKLPSSSTDSLFTERTEDVHLVAGSSSGMKKSKKKKKLPTDEVVNAEPSSVHDAGKEGSKENVGTVSKDSDKVSGSVIVSELNVQHATLSGTVEVSQKQKHTKPIEEVVEGHKLPSSSVGISANGPDAANEKGEIDALDSGARSGSKGRKSSKKHHSTDVEFFRYLSMSLTI